MTFSAGGSDNSDASIEAAQEAQEADIHMFIVGVSQDVDDNELKQMSSDPKQLGENYFMSPDFENLSGILRKLLTKIVH